MLSDFPKILCFKFRFVIILFPDSNPESCLLASEFFFTRFRPFFSRFQITNLPITHHLLKRIYRHRLIQFTTAHFDILEKEIKDTKALMQWAGPKYSYPLSWDQMKNKIDEQDENGQKNFLFSAEILNLSEVIGHVQLSMLDRTAKIGNIGSLLVFSKFRNMGLGKEIVKEIMKLGFHDKNLNELRLGVFDFNSPAIRCYRKIGFKDYDFEKNAREIENESWNLIRMKITKEEFLKHVERGPSMART